MLAYDSTELITNSGALYESGTARPRWQPPGFSPLVGDRAVTGAALLDDVAVLVEQAGPPSRDHSLRLRVVGRTDGVVRRSFEGADLPTERNFRPIVLPAPGALVVGGSDELVAVGWPRPYTPATRQRPTR
ncbi:hypothetical protein [Pseudonocardia sp. MH-G8]|uniref:hypothetical protein n=1 Tax=Pseudonocardia sp. MH-G8 TaxID=1854588 RepID=UPI000BA0F634|nr:hypothetical protein [Pseudonocardia sp. MH-G8]OZM81777.1 hypothetical protein CFP66_12560 [Pseudonocardia sp. MH-G8]